MNSRRLTFFAVSFLLLNFYNNLHALRTIFEAPDLELNVFGKFKPELFWGDNISLLNRNNQSRCKPLDRIFFARHTFDITTDILYGKKTWERPVTEFLFTIRNRSTWGNPESIASTTFSEFRLLDAVTGTHRHFIPRLIFWMREIWLEFSLGKPIGLDLDCPPVVTLGLFPFQLGRGIALGDAYATGPELLGFYTETIVDQYAPGAKISGDIFPGCLRYDIYAAILNNRSSSLGDTGAKIYSQEFGRRQCPARGFGIIDYLVAARLRWKVFTNEKLGSFELEPYGLYNHDPEQKVEFFGDASARLGTLGLAGEYLSSSWEFGFDYAINLGRQKVKGWDRNQIELQNRNAKTEFVNTHVFVNANPLAANFPSNSDAFKAPHSPSVTITPATAFPPNRVSSLGRVAQNLINRAPEGEQYNGQKIGTITGFSEAVGDIPNPTQADVETDQFFNAKNRFRNPYTNKFEGWMIVADAACWLYQKDLKFAVTAGAASGDANPNEETIDGNFTGFIGIQDIYSGKRVRSAFVLGGAGKLRRPLSVPETIQAPSPFSSEVSSFTNLVFTGAALTWTPTNWEKKFSWNPNVLAYWEQFPTKKFVITSKTNAPDDARTFLGVEVNSFIRYYLLKDLVIFFVGSLFFPGGHYEDIKGKPLNRDQERALDNFIATGFSDSQIPNIGTDTAITLNFGLEYSF